MLVNLTAAASLRLISCPCLQPHEGRRLEHMQSIGPLISGIKCFLFIWNSALLLMMLTQTSLDFFFVGYSNAAGICENVNLAFDRKRSLLNLAYLFFEFPFIICSRSFSQWHLVETGPLTLLHIAVLSLLCNSSSFRLSVNTAVSTLQYKKSLHLAWIRHTNAKELCANAVMCVQSFEKQPHITKPLLCMFFSLWPIDLVHFSI